MKTLRIGSCALGGAPRIVAVVDRMLPMRGIAALKRDGADLLEVRVDLIEAGFDDIMRYVKKLRGARLPIIGTIREAQANRGVRLEMFQRLVPEVDCIDIEIDARIGARVIAAARMAGSAVMVSEHDFAKTPDVKGLRRIAAAARRQGADIVKIAALARRPDDVTRLLRYCEDSPVPMVAVSMGALGAVSRILAPLFGSLFSYACIDTAVAPGQMRVKELADLVRRVYPGRR